MPQAKLTPLDSAPQAQPLVLNIAQRLAATKNFVADSGNRVLDLKEKIRRLLIAGAKPSEIAAHLGCDPSYISQLCMDVQFLNDVLEARSLEAAKIKTMNSRYDNLEEKLLDKLEFAANMPMKTFELLRALSVVGGRKREPVLPVSGNLDGKGVVVKIQIPQRMREHFVIDAARNDVVGIGERSLAPMPSSELIKDAEKLDEAEKANREKQTLDALKERVRKINEPSARNAATAVASGTPEKGGGESCVSENSSPGRIQELASSPDAEF